MVVNLSNVQKKARDARRISDIKAIDDAIKLYYNDNNVYPSQPAGCNPALDPAIFSTPECTQYTIGRASCLTNIYILGLSNYLAALPKDPGPADPSVSADTRGYVYMFNGTDYKIMASRPESCSSNQSLADPVRNCWAWSYYSTGAAAW